MIRKGPIGRPCQTWPVEYVLVCLVALLASGLTLYSGFGLGTLLVPAFALFFPVPVAVAATAVVHLANNLFKVGLVGRRADWGVVGRFALPAAIAAIGGAWLLGAFAEQGGVITYTVGGHEFEVTVTKLVIGVLIMLFAVAELVPRLATLSFDRKYLSLGGLVSGFFGGLSGNQGALRSMFLLKAELDQQAFVGTGTVSAVIVDLARLPVYGAAMFGFASTELDGVGWLVVAATLSAFAGAWVGSRYLKKVTMVQLRRLVGSMLIVVGAGMATGLL